MKRDACIEEVFDQVGFTEKQKERARDMTFGDVPMELYRAAGLPLVFVNPRARITFKEIFGSRNERHAANLKGSR